MARRRWWLQALLMQGVALTSCELVSGLEGDRRYVRQKEPAVVVDGGEPPLSAGEHSGGQRSGPMAQPGQAGEGEPGAEGGQRGAAEPTDPPQPPNDPEVRRAVTGPSCLGNPHVGCDSVDPCVTLQVPGGKFQLGRGDSADAGDYFPNGAANELPAHEVEVSPFWLDEHEVTVGRFRRFVEAYDQLAPFEAEAGDVANAPGSGWKTEWHELLPTDEQKLRTILRGGGNNLRTWTDEATDDDCRPINFLDWRLAYAFCVWDGGRLPTEAEWEFAAAGGAQERLFPWGRGASEERAVHDCAYSGQFSCAPFDLPRVGSLSPLGDGRYGHADLAGSVGEPTRDAYDNDSYTRQLPMAIDPVNLIYDNQSDDYVLRGGSFSADSEQLRVNRRWRTLRGSSTHQIGVRCARDL